MREIDAVTVNKRMKLNLTEIQSICNDDAIDDEPAELVITPSYGGGGGGGGVDLSTKSIIELNDEIKRAKSNILFVGPKLPDKGLKLNLTLQRLEAELETRKRMHPNKGGGVMKCEETIQLSDQSDEECAIWLKEKNEKKAIASSKFTQIFSGTLDHNNDKCVRKVNAFDDELSYVKPCKEKKVKQNGLISGKGRYKPRFSSKPQQFRCPTVLGDRRKGVISNGDKKVHRSLESSCLRVRDMWETFTESERKSAPRDQPSVKSSPKASSLYHLLDEDIEEPDFLDIPNAKKLSDCMKDITVYYPSRYDQDPVEVTYTDMKCLEPGQCLSSSIMNFYIRYLQQLTALSENAICNYHFFNTYFYNKLQKLSYKEDSFLKFRKWWKRINIFEKAYILLPVHEHAHWSLVIICIPAKKDELGPIVLHLDSLGIHDSTSICDNIRSFVKKEWSYLQNSEFPLDLPISDEIWENLDLEIIDKRMAVPQQKNAYDCGLFVLFYMERFIKEAPERLTEKDLSMFSRQWFRPEEASGLRTQINNLLVEEFKITKEKEPILPPKC